MHLVLLLLYFYLWWTISHYQIYTFVLLLLVMYCCAETIFVKLFWLIMNLTSGPYPGHILGWFGVRPANVGSSRVLGWRPGRPPAGPGFRSYHYFLKLLIIILIFYSQLNMIFSHSYFLEILLNMLQEKVLYQER